MKKFKKKKTGLMMTGIFMLIIVPVVALIVVYFTKDDSPSIIGEYEVYYYVTSDVPVEIDEAIFVEELTNGGKIYKYYPSKFEIKEKSWEMTISEDRGEMAGVILGTDEGNEAIFNAMFTESIDVETTWEIYKDYIIFCFNMVGEEEHENFGLYLIGQIEGGEVIIQMLTFSEPEEGDPMYIAHSLGEAKSMIDEFISAGYTKLYQYFVCGNIA